MTKNNGGPAFAPSGAPDPTDETKAYYGMSLRDWFAGQNAAAMVGGAMAAQVSTSADDAAVFARSAYLLADAMIAERSK